MKTVMEKAPWTVIEACEWYSHIFDNFDGWFGVTSIERTNPGNTRIISISYCKYMYELDVFRIVHKGTTIECFVPAYDPVSGNYTTTYKTKFKSVSLRANYNDLCNFIRFHLLQYELRCHPKMKEKAPYQHHGVNCVCNELSVQHKHSSQRTIEPVA